MAEETKNGGRTKAEKFKNYAFGIGACTALILGLGNLLFDKAGAVEDKADSGYEKLAKTVNKLVSFSGKVQLKLAIIQAREQERTSMKLFQKLEASVKENKLLRERLDVIVSGKKVAMSKPRPAGAGRKAVPARTCPPGWVTGAGGRCRRVHSSVAAKMHVTDMKAQAAKLQFELERARRKKLEREKKAMSKKMQAVQKADIKHVPSKLDDVTQKKATVPKLPTFKNDS